MNMNRLYVLLVVWCMCLLAPGLLIATGLFGPVGMATELNGAMAGAWVVGYLAQFAIFMWMMHVVDEQRILWWFVVSLLPWAVDWTVPVSDGFVFLWIPATLAFAAWIALVNRREASLQQHGIHATGTVLEVLKPFMNVVVNNVYIRRSLRVRIERADGSASYEGVFKGLFMLGEIPSVGDRIPLLVDPANPQRFEYDKKADADEVPRVHAASFHASPRSGIADDLERLSALRDHGALSDAEFDAAKKKLLHT